MVGALIGMGVGIKEGVARVLANQDSISMNQFIMLAVAETAAALLTVEYLAQRGQRGSREQFDAVLAKIHAPTVQSDDADRLPSDATLHID